MKTNNTLTLTLCNRCAAVYYGMKDRDIKRKDYKQKVKDSCDICQRGRGFEFEIKEK